MPGAGGGVQPGSGRPPSVIREHLRGSFYDRVGIITDIADGKPMQHARLRMIDILPHIVCTNCGESHQAAPKADTDALLEFDAMISASPKDRLAALDLAAKYGLGTLKEVSIENVRERVAGTLEVIRSHIAPEVYQAMLPQLRAQWA